MDVIAKYMFVYNESNEFEIIQVTFAKKRWIIYIKKSSTHCIICTIILNWIERGFIMK